MDKRPASISFDVDALGNMEYRIDWAEHKQHWKTRKNKDKKALVSFQSILSGVEIVLVWILNCY